MNSLLRRRAIFNRSVCVRKNSYFQNIQCWRISNYIKEHLNCYKSIFAFNSNLRLTLSYWYIRHRELLDVVNVLDTPTVFPNLSAADFYWPELVDCWIQNLNISN